MAALTSGLAIQAAQQKTRRHVIFRRDWERAEMAESQDQTLFRVVINHEEQYSIWPAEAPEVPLGWRVVGEPGSKQKCLEYIEQNWTDMRPASIRRRMEEGG
jgi:MbtH protein